MMNWLKGILVTIILSIVANFISEAIPNPLFWGYDIAKKYYETAKTTKQLGTKKTQPSKAQKNEGIPVEVDLLPSDTAINDENPAGKDIDQSTIIQPINNIFNAWKTLDLQLYSAQWHENAIQFSNNKKYTKQELIKKREIDFRVYSSVEVLLFDLISISVDDDGGSATVYVKYSMAYHKPTGKTYYEKNLIERYVLLFDPTAKAWLIKQNDDHL